MAKKKVRGDMKTKEKKTRERKAKKPSTAKAKTETARWLFCITEKDRIAMEALKDKYRYGSLVNALRWALKGQRERDAGDLDQATSELQERVKKTVINMLDKARHHQGTKMKMWSCWLEPSEFKEMEDIAKKHSFERNAEAMRFALRVQAEVDGLPPEGGTWE